MKEIYDRIEAGFLSWGRTMVRHRFIVIVLVGALSAILMSGLSRITSDFSDDNYLVKGDEVRRIYDEFRAHYGQESPLIVTLAPSTGVFDLDFLERLRARVHANPLYENTLLSSDERFSVILLKPDTYSGAEAGDANALAHFTDASPRQGEPVEYLSDDESMESLAAIRRVLDRHRTPNLELDVVGAEVLGERLTYISIHDMRLYSGISIGVIAIALVLLFRRTSAALLSLLVVVISVLSTFGWMGWVGIPFTIPVQILPSFLIAVGICDAVHILTIVYQGLGRGESREAAIEGAIAHSGLAVAMTSITTAAGLASFTVAELAPVASLGVLAPVGILACAPLQHDPAPRTACRTAPLARDAIHGSRREREFGGRRPAASRHRRLVGTTPPVDSPGRIDHHGRGGARPSQAAVRSRSHELAPAWRPNPRRDGALRFADGRNERGRAADR
jgi:predicted RND superfamily exporter protein